MKKALGLILVSVILLFISPSIKAAPTEYKSDEYGVSFTVPSGWDQVEIDNYDGDAKVKYENYNHYTIMFGYEDVWIGLSDEEKTQYKRSDINNSRFTIDGLIKEFEQNFKVNSLEKVNINEVEYFKLSATTDSNGTTITYFLYYNGIRYSFYFDDVNTNSIEYHDYETFLHSIKYENNDSVFSHLNMLMSNFGLPNNSSNQSLAFTIMSSIFFTFLIYCGPVLIYRFGIKKEPVSAKKAKTLSFKFGLVSVIFVIIIGTYLGDLSPGGAVFLYSLINYYILKSGKSKKIDVERTTISELNIPEEMMLNEKAETVDILVDNGIENNKIVFCSNCGKKNSNTSNFCRYCGFKIQKNDEEFVKEDELINERNIPSLKIQKSHIPIYCKKCGGEINSSTKKCSKCGKQYFHFPIKRLSTRVIIYIVLGILIIGLAGLNITQFIKNEAEVSKLNEQLKQKEVTLERVRANSESGDLTITQLRSEITQLRSEINWYRRNW